MKIRQNLLVFFGNVLLISSLNACLENKGSDSHFVYKSGVDNPYRNDLVGCTQVVACSLEKIPFLGMVSAPPTIEDLLNRLVISHQWMGERFESILRGMDPRVLAAILRLSGSITAITISADIRPSHYNLRNSAIYLDPLLIALTREEADTVDQEADFRSEFGKDFQFIGVWRYVTSENEYHYNLALENRKQKDIMRYMARLLFHELAHANHYFSHKAISSTSCADMPIRCRQPPILAFFDWAAPYELSHIFEFSDVDYGLQDTNMKDYAKVRYSGKAISSEQEAWSATDMGGWFGADRGVHDYSYTTQHEDIAMLTEATLTKFFYDADMDVAYIDRPESGEFSADTPVTWGRRGRLGNPLVSNRAKHLMDLMIPNLIPDEFFTNLATTDPERNFASACGWLDNLDLVCSPANSPKGIRSKSLDSANTDGIDISFDTWSPHGRSAGPSRLTEKLVQEQEYRLNLK